MLVSNLTARSNRATPDRGPWGRLMRFRSFLSAIALAMLAVGISPAFASVLLVNSYDMPNGNGQFVYGTYNYWDGNYSGSGAKTTDNAALSGGRGALTDGVISTTGFGINSNNDGTGLYVGWKFLDPV